MLHPDLDEIIRRIQQSGIIATLITNGYLLTPEGIQRLKRTGLDHIEMSIDNVKPDAVSKKSLKVLDEKLRHLAEFAEFHVNINTVLGAGVLDPQDNLVIAQRARELGFTSTLGIVHGQNGQLISLGKEQQAVFAEFVKMGKRSYTRYNHFQQNLAWGLPND